MRRFHILLSVIYFYLGWRLSPGLGDWVWPALIVPIAGVLLYPTEWLRSSFLNRHQHLFRWKVYLDIGYLCFLTSIVVLRDLAYLVLVSFRPKIGDLFYGFEGSLVVLILAFIALGLGLWTALSGPKVKSLKIPIANLPESLEGYRIVQISDLHIGPSVGARYVKKVVRKVNHLAPQMTVLTGDIVDGDADHHLETASHLSALEPSGQILYVTGNHEYYWDGPRWIREFESLGLHVLQNSKKIIQHESHEILVAGILDPAVRLSNPEQKPDLQAALGAKRDSAVKILLAHQPDFAYEAADHGFDLMLSGHTHAGQFFPFTLFIFSVQKFVKGLKACGNMWVYVNQGTGYWGPPIRLGTVTEITLLELTGQKRFS